MACFGDEYVRMPIWIDNTGLHSVGRALDSIARGPVDVDGLLQFATLLIFSDRIQISEYEANEIARTTREYCHGLFSLGVSADSLVISPITSDNYWAACLEAAEICAEQLPFTFDASAGPTVGMHPDMPSSELTEQMGIIRSVGTCYPEDEEVERLASSQELRKATFAVRYMLLKSRNLRDEVEKIVNRVLPSDVDAIARLEAHIRMYLNYALARQQGALCAPAVARARTIRNHRQNVVGMVLGRLDETLASLGRGSLGFPSVVSALLKRSKGDPQGLMYETLVLRDLAAPFRDWAARLANAHDVETPEGYLSVRREIEQMVHDARVALKLGYSEPSVGAIELSVEWGLPSLGISAATLSEHVRRFFRRKTIVILTEISRWAIFPDDEGTYYVRLLQKCGRRAVD